MTGDATTWTGEGTALLLAAMDRLDDAALAGPSPLPGWSRAHVLAHLEGNADALRRLARWARTGEPSPMYASAQQRAADIEAGAARPAGELRERVRSSSSALAADLDALSATAWEAPVVTAQGRTVPARTIPWMRAREVCIHVVDLDAGVTFAELPRDFLVALVDEVSAHRSATGEHPALTLRADDHDGEWQVQGRGDPVEVTARLADLACWLTGRGEHGLRTGAATPPTLPRWL